MGGDFVPDVKTSKMLELEELVLFFKQSNSLIALKGLG
jgi:hypothetical protein